MPIEERLAGLDSTYDVIVRAARRWPDSVALAFVPDGDSTAAAVEVTYRELLGKVTQAANAFHALGVGPDDVVSYVLPNSLETHFAIWGGQAAGIVNAVNPLLEPGHIAHILNAVESKVLVTLGPTPGESLWRKIDSGRAGRCRACGPYWWWARTGRSRPTCFRSAGELDRQPADRLVSGRRIRRDELASCFHTGGTTGLPKVARHTHLNELANAWSTCVMAGLSERDTLLCGLPLFHVNGVVVTGLAPFMVGATSRAARRGRLSLEDRRSRTSGATSRGSAPRSSRRCRRSTLRCSRRRSMARTCRRCVMRSAAPRPCRPN